MPNTYTQLFIHLVFAVKYRKAVIAPEWEDKLHKYITGIVKRNGHKLLAINSVPDHLHMFIGLNPAQSISELMRQVKGDSAEYLNKERLTFQKFHWQEGYGAFTTSKSHVAAVINYIQNQKEHHKKCSFKEEYLKILNDYKVEYEEKYLFGDLE